MQLGADGCSRHHVEVEIEAAVETLHAHSVELKELRVPAEGSVQIS